VIVRDVARRWSATRVLLVIVTNPVDVMTQVAAEAPALPLARVIGTGTMLDTARLREALGRTLDLEPRSIHALVVGEHGDSEVVLWSGAPHCRPSWTAAGSSMRRRLRPPRAARTTR
jgi:L-lactate dehydrogenase